MSRSSSPYFLSDKNTNVVFCPYILSDENPRIRASYSVRIIFIRRILERSRVRPARISSVYVVPGTVSPRSPHFLHRCIGALPAPLRSARTSPPASTGSDYSLYAISGRERFNPRTQIDVARHTSGGRGAETRSAETAFGQYQRPHCGPVDVDGRWKQPKSARRMWSYAALSPTRL